MSAPVPLEASLGFATYTAELAVSRLYRQYLCELGITYPQLLVITLLHDDKPRSVTEIGRLLGLDVATVTPILRRLAAANLVSRERGPEDLRVVTIRLTPACRPLLDKLLVVQANVDLDFGLARDELTRLRHTLLALARRINHRCGGLMQESSGG